MWNLGEAFTCSIFGGWLVYWVYCCTLTRWMRFSKLPRPYFYPSVWCRTKSRSTWVDGVGQTLISSKPQLGRWNCVWVISLGCLQRCVVEHVTLPPSIGISCCLHVSHFVPIIVAKTFRAALLRGAKVPACTFRHCFILNSVGSLGALAWGVCS